MEEDPAPLTCITDSSLLESVSEFSAALIAVAADIYNPPGNGINPEKMQRLHRFYDRLFSSPTGARKKNSSQPRAGYLLLMDPTKFGRRGAECDRPVASSSGKGRHRLRTAGLVGFKMHTPLHLHHQHYTLTARTHLAPDHWYSAAQ